MPSGLALDFIARMVGGYFALFYFVLPECSPLGKETLFYNRKGNKTDRTAWHFVHRKNVCTDSNVVGDNGMGVGLTGGQGQRITDTQLKHPKILGSLLNTKLNELISTH